MARYRSAAASGEVDLVAALDNPSGLSQPLVDLIAGNFLGFTVRRARIEGAMVEDEASTTSIGVYALHGKMLFRKSFEIEPSLTSRIMTPGQWRRRGPFSMKLWAKSGH